MVRAIHFNRPQEAPFLKDKMLSMRAQMDVLALSELRTIFDLELNLAARSIVCTPSTCLPQKQAIPTGIFPRRGKVTSFSKDTNRNV
jgi:hypothetical protein